MKSDFLVVHKSIVPENFVAVIETRKLIEFKKINIKLKDLNNRLVEVEQVIDQICNPEQNYQ